MSSEQERQYGYKKLTIENWDKPDEALRSFVRRAPDVSHVVPVTGRDWAAMILRVELSEKAPLEVRKAFEVAKGVMLYGGFFYPLYALGEEQIFRVVEMAAKVKCRQVEGCPKKADTFHKRLEFLREKEMLSADAFARLDAVRRLRNAASHPEDQMIDFPGGAISILRHRADMVNRLFDPDAVLYCEPPRPDPLIEDFLRGRK